MKELHFYLIFPGSSDTTHPDSEIMNYGGSDSLDLNLRLICEVYRKLKQKHPHIKWKVFDSYDPKRLYNPCLLTIENPSTKKFIGINTCDHAAHIIEHKDFKDNCLELLACAGMFEQGIYHYPLDYKFTPIAWVSGNADCVNRIEELYKQNQIHDTRIIPKKLFFRGASYGIRPYLQLDDRFELQTERILGKLFAEELNRYKINIDVDAIAEISCRTYDIMGLGSALIRPKLQSVKFHNPLIPDYHYAALKVGIEDFGNPKILLDAYIDRFEDLKRDPEYVEFLSKNGRAWYEENCIMEKTVEIITSLINVNILL